MSSNSHELNPWHCRDCGVPMDRHDVDEKGQVTCPSDMEADDE